MNPKFNKLGINKIEAYFKENDSHLSYKEVFDIMKNLDEIRFKMATHPIIIFNLKFLTTTPTLTLKTIALLIDNNYDKINHYRKKGNKEEEDTFVNNLCDRIKKLSEYQCTAIVKHGIPLDRAKNSLLEKEATLKVIEKLKEENPNLTGIQAFEKIESLSLKKIGTLLKNKSKIKGFAIYGLTASQVMSKSFGLHTLTAIDKLKRENNNLTNQEALNAVKELTSPQVTMFLRGLTIEQVMIPNFTEKTKKAINTLMNVKKISTKEAYDWVKGLDKHRVDAVAEFFISRKSVEHIGFDDGVYYEFMKRHKAIHPECNGDEIFNFVKQFNHPQLKGIFDYGLTESDVKYENFGQHTLDEVLDLSSNNNLTKSEAFNLVKGLNSAQIDGIYKYDLTKNDVLSNNFGQHTISAMQNLKNQCIHTTRTLISYSQAFNMVKGFSKAQCLGYVSFRISKDKLSHPAFGMHHIDGLKKLIGKHPTSSLDDLFKRIEGLNEHQTLAIATFDLSREQVENKYFSKSKLKAMGYLHEKYPEQVSGEHLYETVMETMAEYQINGILNCNLTLAQVGIEISSNNKFENKTPENPNFSGKTINAIDFIKLQKPNLSLQEIYNIAIALNNKQNFALINYGLMPEDVKSSEFQDLNEADNIIEKLTKKLSEKLDDKFELPIAEEDYDIARTEFHRILKEHKKEKETTMHSKKTDLTNLASLKNLDYGKRKRKDETGKLPLKKRKNSSLRF